MYLSQEILLYPLKCFHPGKKMLLLPSSVCRRLQYTTPPHLAPKVRLTISLKQCVLSVLHQALAAETGRDG